MSQLRDFQSTDVAVINKMTHALIGHEQGLGKTIIASQLDAFKPGTLVVCPSSLRLNWAKEIRIWRPELSVQIIRTRKDTYDNQSDIIICSFDLLQYVDLPSCYTLVVDESHYVKNRTTKRAKAVALFAKHADNIFLMSGTPMPNRTRELWTQLKLVRATKLSYSDFTKKFSAAHKNRFGWDDSGASNLKELKELVGNVMVRRLKKDVLKELPEKQFQIIELDGKVSAAEREFADSILDAKGNIRLDPQSTDFSELSNFRHQTGLDKLDAAVDHIKMTLESTHKLVLFAHHKDVIAELKATLYPIKVVTVTGDDSLDQKAAAVEAFQTDDSVRVIIGSEAMYEGWTLTAASQVQFVELNWVPGRMAQGADRVHRIGQRDSVLIQFLVIRDGLDHRILESNFEKLTHIEAVI